MLLLPIMPIKICNHAIFNHSQSKLLFVEMMFGSLEVPITTFDLRTCDLQGVPKKWSSNPAATAELLDHLFWDTLYIILFSSNYLAVTFCWRIKGKAKISRHNRKSFRHLSDCSVARVTLYWIQADIPCPLIILCQLNPLKGKIEMKFEISRISSVKPFSNSSSG